LARESLLEFSLSGKDQRSGKFPAEAALDLRPTAAAIQSNPNPRRPSHLPHHAAPESSVSAS